MQGNIIEIQENKKAISDLVSISLGKTMNIKYITNESAQNTTKDLDIQQIAEGNDIPFNIIN